MIREETLKTASCALQESKFRDLLETAPDAMVIVDGDGRIVLVNSQCEALFGYRREELLGQPVEILVPQRLQGAHHSHRGRFFAHPRTRTMGAGLELFARRKDGSEFPVEISLSPLETADGLLVSSAIRDVTERRLVEQSLQRANRMKSEFLASMSHELRTPLNAIIGFAEVLFDERPGTLNAKQKEYLGDVLNSGRHLLRLINGVLDLAKIEAGRMTLEPERFSLREAISEVCSVLGHLAREKEIALSVEVEPSLDLVLLDQPRLKQVLYNLLSNAVKFTARGGQVQLRAMREVDGWFAISVADNGIGIRADQMERLFVEFQQLDSSAARAYQGTGLGLALTRKLVELHGGRIDAVSEFGVGSTFTALLPISVSLVQT